MKYRSVKILTDTEAAWLAGLIDGEGTVTVTRHKASNKFKSPQVSVSSTSYELLRTTVDMTGLGFISQKKKYQEHHRQSYHWQISSGTQAVDLLKQLLPFLRESKKWKRARKIVSEWRSVTPRNGKYSDAMAQRKLRFEEEFFTI